MTPLTPMHILDEGLTPPPTRLIYERDEDTGRIRWDTVTWRAWLQGWLPWRVVESWRHQALARAIAGRRQLGLWTWIPPGYTHQIIHHRPGLSADPLEQRETIGIKLSAGRAEAEREPHAVETPTACKTTPGARAS